MAVQLRWSLVAQDDLKEIVEYICLHNPTAAELFSTALVERTELLTEFSEMGRVVPEQDDLHIREIIYRGYRIVYRLDLDKNVIEIIRVWHSARGKPEI